MMPIYVFQSLAYLVARKRVIWNNNSIIIIVFLTNHDWCWPFLYNSTKNNVSMEPLELNDVTTFNEGSLFSGEISTKIYIIFVFPRDEFHDWQVLLQAYNST